MSYSGNLRMAPFFESVIEEAIYEEPIPRSSYNRQSSTFSLFSTPQVPQKLKQNQTANCGLCMALFFILVLLFVVFFLTLVVVVVFTGKCEEGKLAQIFDDKKSVPNFGVNWNEAELKREQEYKSQKIKWIPSRELNISKINQLEPAGNELFGDDAVLLYVARGKHLKSTVVGKFCPYIGTTMFYGFQGKEYETAKFEVLSYPPGTLSWSSASMHVVPANKSRLSAGITSDSEESVYICRIEVNDNLVIGKYIESDRLCVAAFAGNKHTGSAFEILIINKMGRWMKVDS